MDPICEASHRLCVALHTEKIDPASIGDVPASGAILGGFILFAALALLKGVLNLADAPNNPTAIRLLFWSGVLLAGLLIVQLVVLWLTGVSLISAPFDGRGPLHDGFSYMGILYRVKE